MKKSAFQLLTAFILCASLHAAFAQGTAFTYQGRLNTVGGAANGSYDLTFTVYGSTNLLDTSVAGPLTNSAVVVSNGLFTVTLDFGGGIFDGNPRWLEIGVRTNGGGAFTTLIPRQALLPAPYAIAAGNLVGSATNQVNSVVQAATNAFVGTVTNIVTSQSYVTASITNGLATTSYVNTATNGHVTASITNGLATTNFVNTAVQNGTNNLLIVATNAANLVGVLPQYPTVQIATNAPFTNAVLTSPDGTNRVWMSFSASNVAGLGSAALQNTNFFDLANAGTAAAQAATNGYVWGTLYDSAGTATTAVQAAVTPFTIVLIPDTQFLSTNASGSNLWYQTCGWISSQVANLNIKAVLSLGDITQDATTNEFSIMQAGYNLLTNQIPVLPAVGNHDGIDQGDPYYLNFNAIFTRNWITNQYGWSGGFYNGGLHTTNANQNSYLVFTNAGITYVCLTMQFGGGTTNNPLTSGVGTNLITWASNVCLAFPLNSSYCIFTTHAFLQDTGFRDQFGDPYDPVTWFGMNFTGEQLWGYWKQIPNLGLIANGHFLVHSFATIPDQLPAEARRIDPGTAGNWINQLVCDHQDEVPPASYVKLLTFYPAQNVIYASTVDIGTTSTNYVAADAYTMPIRGDGNIPSSSLVAGPGTYFTTNNGSQIVVNASLVAGVGTYLYTNQSSQIVMGVSAQTSLSDLSLWLPMTEGTNLPIDLSTNGWPVSCPSPSWSQAPGVGNVWNQAGTNQSDRSHVLSIPNSSSLYNGTNFSAFTFLRATTNSFLMSAPAIFMGRFTASSDGGWFMGLQGTSPSAPIIRVAWVGTDNTRTNFDFTANTNTINVFDTNNFHNVGLTFTNGILTEYWDGVPFTTNTGVLPCHVNANSFCVGGDASPNGYTFAAQYADVRIYEHALSQSEINNIIARFPSNRAADVVSLMTTAGGTFSGAVTNSYGFVGNGGGLTNYQGTNLANGGSSVGQILTATTSGVTWSNAPSVGGSATNAINNNGGSGTNLTVYGTLTSTNMLVSMTNVATSVGGGVSLSTVTNVAIAISDTNGAAQAATNNFMVTATNIAQSIANGVSGPTNGITATTATNIANSFYIQSTNAANLVGVLPQYPTVQVATNAPFTNAILASPDGTNRVWVSSIPLQAITNSGQSLVSVSTNCLTWTGNSWIFGKPDGTGQSTNTTIALLSGSTARAGRLLLHNTGTPSGAVISNVGTLTFGETYASPPMVMIAPGWATNAGTYLTALQPYDVTTTNVLIRYSPSSATPAANDSAVYEYWIVP